MTRITPLALDSAPSPAAEMLGQVKSKLGSVPNFFGTAAHSPTTLEFYLKSGEILGTGLYTPVEQEIIALAIAEENACDYCRSAHTAVGKMHGMSIEETQQARTGTLSNPKHTALAKLAQSMVRERGWPQEDAVTEFVNQGWSQAQLIELVAHVARNTFSNYLNHLAGTEVDFPAVPALTPS